MNTQVPQGFWNLLFFYGGKDFAPLVPISLSIPGRGVGIEVSIKTVAKKKLIISSFIHCYQFSSLAF